MATENLPRAEYIEPHPRAIRQHIRRLKRGEEIQPIEACIGYTSHSGTREELIGRFGLHALFASGDLAFEIQAADGKHQKEALNGILLFDDYNVYVSTARTARVRD